MSVKDGLLALLARGPGYGYQLKSDFEAATGGAWSLNVGQVYTSLQRLERDGLVAELPADDEEERRSYELTAAGREHLRSWLARPEPRTVEDRDEVAMKVLLAVDAPGHDPRGVIATQRAATMAALQEHTRRKARSRDAGLAAVAHLDRLILGCKAELDWLDLTEARLEDEQRAARSRAAGGSPDATPTSDDQDDTRTTRTRQHDTGQPGTSPHDAPEGATR